MKKFISRVLICAMLISVLPKTNFADEEKVKSEAVNKEEPAKNEKTEKNAEKKETKVENKKEAKAEEKIEKKEAKPEEKVEKKEEVKETIKIEKPVPVKVRKSENIKPFVTDDYKVEYIFESGTEGKELPAEVLALKPVNQPAVTNGSEISLPDFTEVKVEGGTWKFEKWYVDLQGNYTAVNGNKVKVESADLRLVGVWKFTPNNPEPEKYDVTFTFKSITPGKELADEVKAKTPANKLGVENETVIFLEKYTDVKVIDGTWKFVKWQLATGPAFVDVEDEVTVNGADLNLTGLWKFEPDPEKYNVTFHFVTLTLGKELPTEVLTKKPANQSDLPSGTVIPLPKFEDVKVEGGTWKFRYWYLSLGDHGHEVENEITVENADLFLIGGWEFEKDPEPKKYDVTFRFVSVTAGKDLPQAVLDKLPPNQIGIDNGTLITLPILEDVKVDGGTWKFVKWLVEKEDGMHVVQAGPMVQDEDLKLVGEWKFEEDPKPEKYNVEFQFYSVTKGKELPDKIKAKLPANKTDVLNGTEIPLPNYEDVKVKGGTWKFLGWYSIKGAEHNKVENKVVVDNDNLYLLGQWKFEADKKPQPKPQKPKVQKGRILPTTNVESAFTYVVLALAGIGGAYIAKKKDNE
ncbi:SHIRT domain-containing protein [Parvimonas micra]|uniref:SHIRT domain-containing protein n=1 Tax=Parvimonas micra TaxID=33033 RepID=UPI002B486090|nr:SHIRT domain-containing protein [Parvimonas micra]MEB3060992.1 SHIRT domain-containing protein [Parvimonas micra]MEB3067238.1 SHIRT domain-containing protein [Parvimonas micra]